MRPLYYLYLYFEADGDELESDDQTDSAPQQPQQNHESDHPDNNLNGVSTSMVNVQIGGPPQTEFVIDRSASCFKS